MVYKAGKYEYKDKQQYIDTLGIVFSIFFVCGYFISFFRFMLNDFVYFISIGICMIMMIHLTLKYSYARGKLKSYVFDQY